MDRITTTCHGGNMKHPLTSLVIALGLLAPAATAAHANTYDVYSCWAGAGTFHNPNASSAAWTKDESAAGGHFVPSNDCGLNSTSGSMSIVSLTGDLAAPGQGAEWAFKAPTGTNLFSARI